MEIVNIDLFNKPDWYFDKHRQGKVPVFEKDGKVGYSIRILVPINSIQIVIDSGIIPEFLDGVFHWTAIIPLNPYQRAKQMMLLDQAAPVSIKQIWDIRYKKSYKSKNIPSFSLFSYEREASELAKFKINWKLVPKSQITHATAK